jgi:epoxyqueuosine reductase
VSDLPSVTAARQPQQRSVFIQHRARALGFDLIGIAPAVTVDGVSHLHNWLQRGFAGEMEYMRRHAAAREHPRHVLDGVRSVVVVGMNYHTAEPPECGPLEGRVSRYAWGDDYHRVMKDRLERLRGYVAELVPGCRSRTVVDTAPLLERDFARLAGLGWIGKNTMLINKRMGSWLFLGALLVDFELEYDAPHEANHCGTCTRCLEACPTDAFAGPYQLDSRRCVSYLTIELRGPVPAELREGMGDWIFGCDICQEVCPWNRKAPRCDEVAFEPAAERHPADLLGLLKLDAEDFRRAYGHSALSRPKRAGLLRNAAIALGNARDARAVGALIDALADDEPLVRGAAAWALGRIGTGEAIEALRDRAPVEQGVQVQAELAAALEAATVQAAGTGR